MVNGIAIDLFDFQEKAVIKLLDIVSDSRSKQTVTIKSPTGSGKTIMLIDFIEEYLTKVNSRTAFIWLCPGKGDLEEQSRQKMRKFAPHRHTQNLFDALQAGFDAESTTFINTATLSCNNKNIHDVITHMIPGYDSTKRYKASGYLDAESRVLYFDMTEAEVSMFRASDKAE